jgi:methylmalonyl-CoA/ethylmalonyl-CoA epimerase
VADAVGEAGATPFRAVDHIAVLVPDMVDAIAAFKSDLGLSVVSDDLLADPAVRLVQLDAGNVDIQLVQPIGPGRVADDLVTHGPGLHHICFGVGKLAETLASIGEETTGVFAAVQARPACFLRRSPESVQIEVIEFQDSETPGSFAAASDRVRAYWHDESARDMPAMLEHFSVDAGVEVPGANASGVHGIEAFYQRCFDDFPGLRVNITNQFSGRGSHAFEFEAVLTDAEGVEWEVKGINVLTLRHGKIAFMRSYEDQPSKIGDRRVR